METTIVSAATPLQLTCSWPLIEAREHFDLGALCDDSGLLTGVSPERERALARAGVGLWECDLADDGLVWSAGVYALFGLPPGAALARAEIVQLYADESRGAMERLRAHAIRHRRGFTLDAEIRPVTGGTRWMRLIAAPVCARGRAVRLRGVKRDVTDLYGR